MRKTVLVLGGTRFIGRYILESLDTEVFEVYYFHRGKTCFYPKVRSIEILGDRTIEDDVRKLFNRGFDIVIDISGEEYEMVKLSVQYAKVKQPYYVFISSSSVYRQSTEPHSEEDPLDMNCSSFYTKAKIQSEKLVESSFRKYAIIRPSKVYGPYNHIYRERYFFEKLTNQDSIVLTNDPILHFTYVEDLAEGVLQILNKELMGIFNVAGKEPVRLSRFIEEIAKNISVPFSIFWSNETEAPFSGIPTCMLSVQKIYGICGWKPRFSLEEGIYNTVMYLKGRYDG